MNSNRLLLLLCFLIVGTTVLAQNIKRPDTYNYQRGCEAVENKNYEEALRFLYEEIRENPKNGYAWAWIQIPKRALPSENALAAC